MGWVLGCVCVWIVDGQRGDLRPYARARHTGPINPKQAQRQSPTANALAEVALGVLREGAHEVPRLLARDPLQVLLCGRAQRAGLVWFWGGWVVRGVWVCVCVGFGRLENASMVCPKHINRSYRPIFHAYLEADEVVVVVRGEHGLACQQLPKDGAHRPDVHRLSSWYCFVMVLF